MTTPSHGSPSIAVLLADDHAVVRQGYRRLLEREAGIRIVSEAATADIALKQIEEHQPDVLILDVNLPDMSGIDAARKALQIRPSVRVIMFSMHEDAIFAMRSMAAGAAGYVTKNSDPDELVHAVREVSSGRKYISRDMALKLALSSSTAEPVDRTVLSEREVAIVRLLAEGRSVKDVAHVLGLNVKTVANQQSFIRRKLGVSTSAKLIEVARALGFSPPGS